MSIAEILFYIKPNFYNTTAKFSQIRWSNRLNSTALRRKYQLPARILEISCRIRRLVDHLKNVFEGSRMNLNLSSQYGIASRNRKTSQKTTYLLVMPAINRFWHVPYHPAHYTTRYPEFFATWILLEPSLPRISPLRR